MQQTSGNHSGVLEHCYSGCDQDLLVQLHHTSSPAILLNGWQFQKRLVLTISDLELSIYEVCLETIKSNQSSLYQGWGRVHGKVLEYKYIVVYEYKYLFYQCTHVQVLVHFKVLEYKYEYIFNHIYSNVTVNGGLLIYLKFAIS